MLFCKTGTIYATFFMVTEITAITDNLNWYYKALWLVELKGPKKAWIKDQVLPCTRALTFIFGRVWIGPYSIYKGAVICGGWYPLVKLWYTVPWYISLPGLSIILLFCFLNIVWTYVITMKWLFPKQIDYVKVEE